MVTSAATAADTATAAAATGRSESGPRTYKRGERACHLGEQIAGNARSDAFGQDCSTLGENTREHYGLFRYCFFAVINLLC